MKIKKPNLKNLNSKKVLNFFVNLGSKTIAQIFVLVLVLLAVNVLSREYFFRIDLTETQTYTLSEGTKSIVSSLDENIKITTFFSQDLPPDMSSTVQDVQDLLLEYERFSNGKLEVENVDPNADDFGSRAKEEQVPELEYAGEISQDKFGVAKGYLGLSIKQGEDREVIEYIAGADNFEYEISSRIYKLKQERKPIIGFLTGHGEKSIFNEYSQVGERVRNQFNIESVDLSNGEPIDPAEISILVIASPTESLSPRDQFELDQYILRGGRLIVLADLYQPASNEPPMLSPKSTNLNEFLNHYGIGVQEAVLLDESYFPIPQGFMQIAYPFWVQAQNENIKQDNPALNNLQSIVFFWSNPIEDKSGDARTYTSLVSTTDKAWVRQGPAVFIDVENFTIPAEQGQYDLAALVEGNQTSLFKDKDIPDLSEEAENPTPEEVNDPLSQTPAEEAEVEDKRTDGDTRVDEGDKGRILVIGDSEFIANGYVGVSEQNATFFGNLLEWYSGTDELIDIRSKAIERRPLENTTEKERNLYKAVNIGLIPLILIPSGIIFNLYRKKRGSRV